MRILALIMLCGVLPALALPCGACRRGEPRESTEPTSQTKEGAMSEKIERSEQEWRERLTDEQFCVLREKGTERAFTGKYYANTEKGTYLCAACGREVFGSGAKFKSGTGWPSFYEPVAPDSIETAEDRKLATPRTEVVCSRCGSHLGHVFKDGPAPTGLRYCINSVALDFRANEEEGGEGD